MDACHTPARIEERMSHDVPPKPYWRVIECVGHRSSDGACLTIEHGACYGSEARAQAAADKTNAERGA